ncbi:MAG: hypothetical protein ABIN18_18385 [Pseudomonadota bacterium]
MGTLPEEYREVVTLRTVVLGLAFVVVGGVLMYVSYHERTVTSLPIQALLANIGALFFVTGTITFAWELWGRRAFAKEMRSLFAVSKSFLIAGVKQYISAFQSSEIDWDALFHRARHVDILFMGNSGWRRNQFLHFEALLKQEGSCLNVILPDPNDPQVVAAAAARFGRAGSNPKVYFEQAKDDFVRLSINYPDGYVKIWFINQIPAFSIFRFDESAVVALYSLRRSRVAVPTLICEKGGDLFSFALAEIDAVIGRGGKTPQGTLAFSSKDLK